MLCFAANWTQLSPNCTKRRMQKNPARREYVKIQPCSLNCLIKSFASDRDGPPSSNSWIFTTGILLRYHFTLFFSRPDKAPFTQVDLALVSQLLSRHQRIVTGSTDVCRKRLEGESEEMLREDERSYLFISLPVYLFSLSLPCRPRSGTQRRWPQGVWGGGGEGAERRCFLTQSTVYRIKCKI